MSDLFYNPANYNLRKIDKTLPDDILLALRIRAEAQAGYGKTINEKIAGTIWAGDEAEFKMIYAETKVLYAKGEEYFKQGYRYNEGDRQMFGISHDVPDVAIAWELWPAGHIATSEAYRLCYITRA